MDKPQFPVTVFFDGSCIVCRAEIEHYLQRNPGERLLAVDISTPDFDPAPYNIPLKEFMYQLHVIDRAGNVYLGVEAFRAIWQAFPPLSLYGLLGVVVDLPLVNPAARILYRVFAALRPLLPRSASTCSSGLCRPRRR